MRIILTLQIVLLTDLFLPHFIYKQKWSLNELVLQCVTEVVLKILLFSLTKYKILMPQCFISEEA